MKSIHLKPEKCKDEVSRLLVSLEDAGHMLGVSSRTIRRLSQEGKLLPIVKVGHSSRISRQGLLDYVSSLTTKLGSIAL